MKKLRSRFKRWLFCRAGQHERTIIVAAVNGHGLSYARPVEADIIANVRCVHCPYEGTVMYANARVILQKSKQLTPVSRL